VEPVSTEISTNTASGGESTSTPSFEQLLAPEASSADTYFFDESAVSSVDNNQFLQLSEQLERIVDMASQKISLPPGHQMSPESLAAIESSNKVLQAQAEIVRLSLLMETTSSAKQSVQTLFNMQQ